MKKYLFLAGLVMLAAFFVAFSVGKAVAQEEQAEEYSWGTVVKIVDDTAVVTEYNYETDQEEEVTYKISPEVQLINVAALSEITAGKSIEFRYVMQGADKVIIAIGLDMENEEEGNVPEMPEPSAE